jgi:bacterioferritin
MRFPLDGAAPDRAVAPDYSMPRLAGRGPIATDSDWNTGRRVAAHCARQCSGVPTMKGHPEVIDCLKELLRGELAARDQYFLHSRRYEDQGLKALYERIGHEMQEETEHADAILRRILFLEGDPDMRPHAFTPGTTVVEMLEADLRVEYQVRANLAAAMKLCEQKQDYVSRDMLLVQLKDTEEDHAWWLEQQLGLIKRIGLENYQLSKIDGNGAPSHG